MIGVILNPRSGFVHAHGVDGVRSMILEAVPAAQIHVLERHDDVAAQCKELLAAGATCITAVGGDGTVRSVAAELVETGTPLGVLPGGTLNHFARDVGVGRDMHEALKVLAAGYALPVDVASVNGHIFLNNSSLGLYPRMVELRQRYEDRLGKWRAMVRAAVLATRHAHLLSVTLTDGEGTISVDTRLLFIGNNQYELNLLNLGQRACLDAGELWVLVLDSSNRFRLIPNVFEFLRGRHPAGHFFRTTTTQELTVTPAHERTGGVEVSADGEVFPLRFPLEYRVMPRALNVIVPKPPPPESREARDSRSAE